MPDHLGEVVASSSTRFVAQANGTEPAFGSFVAVDVPGGAALAVVAEVRHGSFDPNRRPTAYGLPADELFAQQPQLRELLVTEFEALLVGHGADGRWRPHLPPHPPGLHAFVRPADELAIRLVTLDGGYLRTLLAAEVSDDLLSGVVTASLAVWPAGAPEQREFLVTTGRALARLLGDDYDRLQAVLGRIGS